MSVKQASNMDTDPDRIQCLKNKQTSALSKVTKKRTELCAELNSSDNLHIVKSKFDEYNNLFAKYKEAYYDYSSELLSDEKVTNSQRFAEHEMNIIKFQSEVLDWISHAECQISDNISVPAAKSTHSSHHSSHSSRSSTRSERAREKAKLSDLLIQKERQSQQFELQQQAHALQAQENHLKIQLEQRRLELRAQQDKLQLDIDISKAVAKEQIYAEAEKKSSRHSAHSSSKRQHNSKSKPDNIDIKSAVIPSSQMITGDESDHNLQQTLPERQTMKQDEQPQPNPQTVSFNSQAAPLHPQMNQALPERQTMKQEQPSQLNPQAVSFDPQAVPLHSRMQQNSDYHRTPIVPPHQHLQYQQQAQLLTAHQQLATAISLPQPTVPMFTGNAIDYNSFIMAFDARIVSRTFSDADRLYYLEQHLQGEPKDLIGGCMYMEPSHGYYEARTLLQREYGDPYKISIAYVNKVLSWPYIKHDDNKALKTFSFFLTRCLSAMKSISHMSVLNHLPNMQAIVQKMPNYIQNKWSVNKLKQQMQRIAQFEDLVFFIQSVSESVNDPVYGRDALNKCDNVNKLQSKSHSTQQKSKFSSKPEKHSFAVSVDEASHSSQTCGKGPTSKSSSTNFNQKYDRQRPQCYFCQKSHDLDDCYAFAKLSMDEKRTFLKEKKMCFGCYGFDHVSKGCIRKRSCKICDKRHPTAMHMKDFQYRTNISTTKQSDADMTTDVNTRSMVTTSSGCITNENTDIILHAIIPVKVQQKDGADPVDTYAFYDNGSSGCFLTNELKNQLNAAGTSTTLQLRTMHGSRPISTIAVSDLIVTGFHGNNPIELPKSFTQDEIPVSRSQIPKPDILSQWPRLKQVADEMIPYQPHMSIGLLIGSNCPKAHQPIKVISSDSNNGPLAILYPHGWTVNGPLSIHYHSGSAQVSCNHISVQEVKRYNEIFSPTLVLKMFEMDFNELYTDKVPGDCGYSHDDKLFLKKADSEIQYVDGHYQLPLPFRTPDIQLPNNKDQAVMRAIYQKKKMLRNQKYADDYRAFMNNLLAKGYAKKVPIERLKAEPGNLWYLPHSGVYHPTKPNKIRIVFDCSAQYHGTSLNDHLIQGPDLTNSLFGVLTRFRQDYVAFLGDIEAMFHQIRVPESHQDYLRFLWWPNGDLTGDLQEYCMTVHIFGATSSPSIANYSLRRTADDTQDEYGPAVTDTIRRNFYVDDCLKSVSDENVAVDLIENLTQACAKGGFKLTKFSSNSDVVLDSIPTDECTKGIQLRTLDYNDEHIERTLGIQWRVHSDTFGFSVKLKDKPTTRRGILSMTSSVFDPLGFIAPFLLSAKKILQDLCKEQKLAWDDKVPEEYLQRWQTWLNELPLLKQVSVDRCIRPANFGEVKSSQLHVFSDASSTGYGSVAYIRLCNQNDEIHCSFLTGKARLAPIKVMTIPKLELTAATVSVRIGQSLLRELDIKIDQVIYHTDSTIVLHYIASEKKRHPVFVSNRVQLIRDYTNVTQWRHVDSKDNPADHASRGLDGRMITQKKCWLQGPSFLWQSENTWPKQKFPSVDPNLDESDCLTSSATTVDDTVGTVQNLIEHFSDWHRLTKAVAVYRKLITILQKRQMQRPADDNSHITIDTKITVQDLDSAENVLLKFTQRQHFGSEIEALHLSEKHADVYSQGRDDRRNCVLRTSSVYRLDPFLHQGLLRVGGRLTKANLDDYQKYPILLPYKSHISALIIRSIHEKLHHAGRNHVLSELRDKYWIIHANSAVRTLISQCVTCRRLRKPVSEQKMSDLPSERCSNDPPFSYTGVDLFGPFMIKRGRTMIKEYGVLFTCMASRAVHIEIAKSLDTDSFIHALRRFMARRGTVRQIRCDNGTNLVSAERELRQSLTEMNHDEIRGMLLKQKIDWIFNPPAASHMGGSWERLIRTVRKVLSQLTREHGDQLDEESFHTLICEVESIVNSRPLTPVSTDPDDLMPLTPSHLLTTKTTVLLPPPGKFQRNDIYMRKRWRRVQYLTNLFWTRWKREYLLTLQERQKWIYPRRNHSIGDVVLVKDDTQPRNNWNMGRIIKVEPDRKGYVRSVFVKTMTSELRRPIDKLVLLLAVEEQSND